MLETTVLLDAPKQLVHVVSPIFCSILHTDETKVSKCTINLVFKTLVGLWLHIGVTDTLTDLQPCVIESFLLAAHLPHHIIHIDVGFTAFALWHRLQSESNAFLRYLGASLIVALYRGFTCRHQQVNNCEVRQGVSVAGLTVVAPGFFRCAFKGRCLAKW